MAGYRRRTNTSGREYWELHWRANGKRRFQSLGPVDQLREGEVRDIAKRKGRELLLAEYAGDGAGIAPRFAAWCTEYLNWHRHEYPASHARVDQLVTQHLLPEFETYTLAGVGVLDIERWKRKRLESRDAKGAAPAAATVAKELRTLRAILGRAVLVGRLRTNPARLVKEPRSTVDRGIRFFSADELQLLYDACVEPWHAEAWRLFAGTGMRRGEGQALKWKQVGIDTLTIISTGEERTKSGEARTVPLSKGAIRALEFFRTWAGRSDLYVLPRITAPSLSRRCIKCCERAGLDGSLHTLRHTFASRLAADPNIPVTAIKEWLGHSTIRVTEQYMHLRQSAADDRLRSIAI